MKILLLLVFCLILYLIYFLIRKFFGSDYNKFILTLMCSFLLIAIVSAPENSIKATYDGSILFFKSVFVSIFPFMVVINIMINYGSVELYSKLFGNIICKPLRLPNCSTIVIIISMLCGYPLGAKYAVDLYEKKAIDYYTCERLLSIASNPSPLYVIGVLGVKMFHNKHVGYLLIFSCYLSCLIMSFIIPPKNKGHHNPPSLCPKSVSINIGNVLKNSINNAITTSLSIGGFIIAFSVLISILKNNTLIDIVLSNLTHLFNISTNSLKSVLLLIIELTNGCNLVNEMSLTNNYKIYIISFLLGFSTFSIIAQIFSFAGKYGFSIKKYILTKLVQGTVCTLITFVLLQILHANQLFFVFNPNELWMQNSTKIYYIQIAALIMLLLPLLITKLFHSFSKLFNIRSNN